MGIRKLYRLEPQAADRLLGLDLIVFGGLFVMSVLHREMWAAIVSLLAICLFLGWRLWRGPMMGSVIVEIDEKHIKFSDPTYTGVTQFSVDDIQELKIVGPQSARQLRVHTKSGKLTEVYRGLRGKRLARMTAFLRKNLPTNMSLTEDDPASWSAVIRGDF